MLRHVAPYPLPPDVPFADACQQAMDEILRDIDAFHAVLVDRYGGSHGVRDQSLLQVSYRPPFHKH